MMSDKCPKCEILEKSLIESLGDFGVRHPLSEIYKDIDEKITAFQDEVKKYRWESPKAHDSCRDLHSLADLLACDIQEEIKKLQPHIPQLNLFKDKGTGK
jgi:hypothetical protein